MAETKYANWDEATHWTESQLDYMGQTFTPATSHRITKLRIRSWTGDGSVDSSTLYVCEVDANKFPTGGSVWYNTYLVKLVKTGIFLTQMAYGWTGSLLLTQQYVVPAISAG